ncbi:unnamed protein product [Discula destructiva]
MFASIRATRLVATLLVTSGASIGVTAELSLETSLTRSSTVSDVLTTLPTCAQSCFTTAVFKSSCSTTDFSCVCDSYTSVLTDVRGCAISCTVNEELTTEKIVNWACGNTVQNEAVHMRSIFWTLYAIALLCFGCRLVARSKKFGGIVWWDDCFFLASFVVLTGVSIGAEVMVIFGMGQDQWQLDDTHITVVLILFYIAEFAYVIESALTKASIVILYLRIFSSKNFRWLCWAMLGFLVCFALVFLISLLTYCVPFEYVWQRWDHRHAGRCINMTAQTYVCAALNIILDVAIFLMPISKLMKLEIDWKAKIGVVLTFMLGLFVTICSIIRLTYLKGWASSTNQTYDYANLAPWSLVELNAGVICACLPGLASLFRRIKKVHIEKKRSTVNNSLYGNNSHASRAQSNSFGSGLRSFGGKDVIVKTTQISVHYNARENNDSSDQIELMEQGVPPGSISDTQPSTRKLSM